jgi:F-type H+-transporting ATPase subunit delta
VAELATLARPYANAVFAIAKQDGALERWSRVLAFLGSAAADDRMAVLLLSPDVTGAQKAHRIAEVCGDEIDDRARSLLQVLAGNQRLTLLPEIADQFEVLKALDEQSLDVDVLSAYPLSDEETERLRAALAKRFAKDVTVASRVDPHLLGGAIIRAGDMVIDGSVRGRLDRLAETLQRN